MALAAARPLLRLGYRGRAPLSRAASSKADDSSKDKSSSISWLGSLQRFTTKMFGDGSLDSKADICNCGADFGFPIPRPDLLEREGIERLSKPWHQQMYGAALYWHVATMPEEKVKKQNPDWLKGKDVLEVGCSRGGGARYLAEVAAPRRYIATDIDKDAILYCVKNHSAAVGLRYEVADLLLLAETYPSESFDFVIAIQAFPVLMDMDKFCSGVAAVLRPGGHLLLTNSFTRSVQTTFELALQNANLEIQAKVDIGKQVHCVGICSIAFGTSYNRYVISKAKDPRRRS